MSEFGKGIPLASGFDLGAKKPLDSRDIVDTIKERDLHVAENRAYEGMTVYVKEDKTVYRYDGNNWISCTCNVENIDLSDYYTKNEVDENGNVTIYVSNVIRNGQDVTLTTVADDSEWTRIKDVLRELSKNQ